MDLPVSVAALGEQLGGAGEIAPDPALFHDSGVFAAERERIFTRPWLAVDHATRLAEDGRYFRFDADSRSIIVTRDGDGRLHALRNVCLHAGYLVCDAEDGAGERLMCPYHGWEYTPDGRLVEPELSSRIDPARLRLKSYPLCIRDGLLFVDPSGGSASDEKIVGPLPTWLADGRVTQRSRYGTTWNWKFVLHFLRSRANLYFDEPRDAGDDERNIEFGPLSWIVVRSRQAVLLRVIPRFAERTDVQLIRIVSPEVADASAEANGADPVADALGSAGEAVVADWSSRLGQGFFAWYWPLMSASSALNS
jgi:nitrite reductase/ring-hydroxylating ferredoxin subunit